jgi:predicted nucleic acid-binding protein
VIVVSDASAVIALSIIGRLEILKELFHEIVIPSAVYHEIAIHGSQRPGAAEVQNSDWITVRSVRDGRPVANLNLGRGEKEAIALYLELKADILLIDEVKARREANRLDITYIGILGVLVEAKRQNIIQKVKPILNELRDNAGFRISNALYEYVMNEVGED